MSTNDGFPALLIPANPTQSEPSSARRMLSGRPGRFSAKVVILPVERSILNCYCVSINGIGVLVDTGHCTFGHEDSRLIREQLDAVGKVQSRSEDCRLLCGDLVTEDAEICIFP